MQTPCCLGRVEKLARALLVVRKAWGCLARDVGRLENQATVSEDVGNIAQHQQLLAQDQRAIIGEIFRHGNGSILGDDW